MKITEQDKKHFSEINKKYNLKESWIKNLFKKRLKKAVLSNPSLKSALNQADKELDVLRKYVKKQEKDGHKVPNYIKRYTG